MSTTELPAADVRAALARMPAAPRPTTIAGRFADLLQLRPPAASVSVAIGLIAEGMSAREIYLDVLEPALRVIGTRWQRGVCSVAQEHLATAVVHSIMTQLAARMATRPPIQRRIVLACTDGESHDTGLRMVRDFLIGDGWEVFYVGGETPAYSLQQLADRVLPDVVGLSTTLPNRIPVARATITALNSGAGRRPFVLLGGLAYAGDAALARRIGGDAFAVDAGEASRLLRCEFGEETRTPRWARAADESMPASRAD